MLSQVQYKMATENQEAAYKKFRNDEKNYEPQNPAMNSGLLSTTSIRAHAKEIADDMLEKNPELADIKEEVKEEKVEEEVKETKSKGKK